MAMSEEALQVAANGSKKRTAERTLLRVRSEIVGITPLLHNRMSREVLERIRTKEKAPKNQAPPSAAR